MYLEMGHVNFTPDPSQSTEHITIPSSLQEVYHFAAGSEYVNNPGKSKSIGQNYFRVLSQQLPNDRTSRI
jgi:hypothetical protein